MAAVAKKPGQDVKTFNYAWTGKDKNGKVVKGELRAAGVPGFFFATAAMFALPTRW